MQSPEGKNVVPTQGSRNSSVRLDHKGWRRFCLVSISDKFRTLWKPGVFLQSNQKQMKGVQQEWRDWMKLWGGSFRLSGLVRPRLSAGRVVRSFLPVRCWVEDGGGWRWGIENKKWDLKRALSNRNCKTWFTIAWILCYWGIFWCTEFSNNNEVRCQGWGLGAGSLTPELMSLLEINGDQ